MTDSAPRTARERARAEITAEILDAARGLFGAQGYAATTVAQIAAAEIGRASCRERV